MNELHVHKLLFHRGSGIPQRARGMPSRVLTHLLIYAVVFLLGLLLISCATGDGSTVTIDVPDGTILVPIPASTVDSIDLESPPALEPLDP